MLVIYMYTIEKNKDADYIISADDKANIFSIEYYKNYKVIQNHKNQQSYVLVQCGTPTPSNITNSTEVYQVPITKAGVMETSIVPYLEVREKE